MILIVFAIFAPLLSFRWRRLAAGGVGITAEIFSPLPFGVALAFFFFIAFFIEIGEQRLMMRRAAGWALAALSAATAIAFLRALAFVFFQSIGGTLALALFISEFLIGMVLIGLLWMPIKFGMTR